jgi:hypothetical protein
MDGVLGAAMPMVLITAAHAAFGIVIWVVCIAAAVIGVLALFSNRRTWEDYRKDHMLLDSEARPTPRSSGAGSLGERDAEIRQMLEARNARRARRGEPPLDVEQELKRLTAPQVDPELRQEVRDLVKARNFRRVRAGKPPLDVESEVEREIGRLGDL